MRNKVVNKLIVAGVLLVAVGCKSSKTALQDETYKQGKEYIPTAFNAAQSQDTNSIATQNWKAVFSDPNLTQLIDSALSNNQELNITMQEIEIAKSEVRARKGEYLPTGGIQLGAGLDKSGEYTRNGAVESQLHIMEDKKFPEPLGDFMIGAHFQWEVDIWRKLRNSKNAALSRYLGSVDGKNFMVTNIVSEIAENYYELLALDKQLEIVNNFIQIQTDVLEIIKQQKDAAKVTQLASNRFEAQLLKTVNMQYALKQSIVEAENKINFLVGRFPQHVTRSVATLENSLLETYSIGTPEQLLNYRPDIQKAERELIAAKLDVKAAKAAFYPTLGISANVGMQAFNPAVWFNPKSLLYNLIGDLFAPLINRNAIRATYNASKAKQSQALIDYQQTILKAFIEVNNQLSNVQNMTDSYKTKAQEVAILNQSIDISNDLFIAARADYMEVLLTQKEALDAKMELIETILREKEAKIGIYRALGGGWK
ncbi:MAG: TolC family protein [Crocinitomicaceae bacterium]|nr:TolC family protein [Crocinitomicaceae bacterium]